jgi:hypothetical protein
MGCIGFEWCIFELGLEHGFESSIAAHAEGIGTATSGFESGRAIVGGQGLHPFDAAKCLFLIGFLGKQNRVSTWRRVCGPFCVAQVRNFCLD